MECKCKALNEAGTCTTFSVETLTAQLEQYQMQQDENQKVGVALFSPAEDRARMSRDRQHMSEDSAARDNLQQKTMELTDELHEAATA